MVSIANKYGETPIDKAKTPLREVLKGNKEVLVLALTPAQHQRPLLMLPDAPSLPRARREAGPEPHQDPLQGHLLEGHDPHAAQ